VSVTQFDAAVFTVMVVLVVAPCAAAQNKNTKANLPITSLSAPLACIFVILIQVSDSARPEL
jgi:hypothetical protein